MIKTLANQSASADGGLTLRLQSSSQQPAAAELRCWSPMRIAAIIIGLDALVHLLYLPKALDFAHNPHWPLHVWRVVSGILLLWISFGIWKRLTSAWQLGFALLAASPIVMFVHVHYMLPALTTKQGAILNAVWFLWLVTCGFLSFIWHHQKQWFFDDDAA